MSVFSSEAKMQEWLSGQFKVGSNLGDLVSGHEWLESASATNIGEARVLASFRTSMASLYITEVLFENEDISLSPSDALKPDFVLYAAETQSVVVVELKNLVSPSRQAGTELAAYSAELRTCVPFLADGDVVHVLISQEWTALLKHYARHEIFWQGRNLICMRPFLVDGAPALEVLSLSELAEDYSTFQIGEGHLGGYCISLYDDSLYSANADRQRLDSALGVFEVALQAMAVTGNRLNSRGFAFLWKDSWTGSLAPYSIVVANFAPFQSLERFVRAGEVPDVAERIIKRVVCEYSPEGHGNTLTEITRSCEQIVEHVCSSRPEGFTTWGALRTMLEGRSEFVSFAGWGMFGEAALEEVKRRHEEGDLSCTLSSPDVGLQIIETLIDPNYEVLDLAYAYYDPDDEEGDENGGQDGVVRISVCEAVC